jgi:hypothetical protein
VSDEEEEETDSDTGIQLLSPTESVIRGKQQSRSFLFQLFSEPRSDNEGAGMQVGYGTGGESAPVLMTL